MYPLAVLVVLATWFLVDGSAVSINITTGIPVGLTADQAESSSPPIGFMIGDSLLAIQYVPGQPLHASAEPCLLLSRAAVRLSYSRGQISQFYLKAVTMFDPTPLGQWLVVSGQADRSLGVVPNDCVVSRAPLGSAGTVSAYWVAPAGLYQKIEFQVTVVGSGSRFWVFRSLLCEAAAESENSIDYK